VRKLIVFNSVTLDGCFTDAKGDMGWARRDDPEWREFVGQNASASGVLVFGRITYDLMVDFWPTPLALQHDPVVAGRMNERFKVVFSRTLEKVTWKNTRLVKGDPVEELRKMKASQGKSLLILGSGSIVAQIAPHGLIDEYQILLCPIALGRGKTMFDGIQERLALKLTKTRVFGNGDVLLCYGPQAPQKNCSGHGG
jgi:dihydrofolate reductase